MKEPDEIIVLRTCECGCGQFTEIQEWNNYIPNRYLLYHHEGGRFRKGQVSPKKGVKLSKKRARQLKLDQKAWYSNPKNNKKIQDMRRKQISSRNKIIDDLKKEGTYDEVVKKRGKNISKGKKGKRFTKAHKKALSKAHWSKKPIRDEVIKKTTPPKGTIPWNKSLTKETDIRVANSVASQPHSEEWNQKVVAGQKSSESRQLYLKSDRFKETHSLGGIANSKLPMSGKFKEYLESERHQNACIKGGIASWEAQDIHPNKPETIFIEVCKKHNLPYKYVGDGQFWLGYPPKNPDFLNVNGEKTVVEIDGIYWHLKRHQKENPQLTKQDVELKEKAHYEKYGFKCIIIWEDELKDEKLILDKVKK